MTLLWPRLPDSVASMTFARLDEQNAIPAPDTAHPSQIFAQVGGRVGEGQLRDLQQAVNALAIAHGFPDELPRGKGPVFDREVAPVVFDRMSMTWAEASSREVWSFVAIVLLPDVTEWRWRHQISRNRERWIATDFTRHTWSRVWWLMAAFESDPSLAGQFHESELNQLLERRSIGGNPRLLVAFSKQLVSAFNKGAPRRALIRDATRRLRRHLAFMDPSGMTESQMYDWISDVVAQSVDQLQGQPDGLEPLEDA